MLSFPDVDAWPGAREFLAALHGLRKHEQLCTRSLFSDASPITIARAPGRLDLMGGIADYSGSLVLEMPIREAAFVAASLNATGTVKVTTQDAATGERRDFDFPIQDLMSGAFSSYERAHGYFAADRAHSWAGYVVGVLVALFQDTGLKVPEGLSVFVFSQVPEGKGVSSSAALEVATLNAVLGALQQTLPKDRIALLCQRAENLVVGAPCGVMDQMTSALGEEGQLLELLCQPAEVLGSVKLPEDLQVWGIDSGVRHAVSGADYTDVRVAAFMGQRILSVHAQRASEAAGARQFTGHPYLANLTPSELVAHHAQYLPTTLRGADFLREFGHTNDTVTRVDPEVSYPVAAATAHPIFEHFRVRCFRSLLKTGTLDANGAAVLGELMYQSHASYGACGLGCQPTDLLVELVRREGIDAGLLGGKITGGGSGGTVAVLGRRGSDAAIQRILEAYQEQTGIASYLFQGSSPGAAAFGTRVLSGH